MAIPNLAAMAKELARLRAAILARREDDHDQADAEFYDWYGPACGCGVAIGECETHHRARPDQRPPAGDWRQWVALSGRAAGKTRSGSEWVRHLAESSEGRRIALVGQTHAAVRDVMIEGESGILSVCPPWDRPRYNPSRCLLVWPNGSQVQGFSAEEPDRLRGPQFTHAWIDELAAFYDPDEVWRQLNFSSRIKSSTGVRKLVTTTPRPIPLIRSLVESPDSVLVRSSSYTNRAHLDPAFLHVLAEQYEKTRFGAQEIYGEIVEAADNLVFVDFEPAGHVTADAEFVDGLPVLLAVDAGTALHTAAVWMQARPIPYTSRYRVSVFSEYHHDHSVPGSGTAEAAARKIKAHGESLRCGGGLPFDGSIARLVVDPFGQARTGNSGTGTAAKGGYELVFGGVVDRWPGHQIHDGVDQVNLLFSQGGLLIHPRCTKLRAALLSHQWIVRRGVNTGRPSDDHPHADFVDALRGGIRDLFPDGVHLPPKKMATVKWSGRP